MNNAIQFNGQVLPEGCDWDMMGAFIILDGKKRFIVPGDWLIGQNGEFTEVLNHVQFTDKYDVEVIIKPKNN